MSRSAGARTLVNRAAVRDYIMYAAAKLGRGEAIKAVSNLVYLHLDAVIRRRLVRMVETHPSGFKTLKP